MTALDVLQSVAGYWDSCLWSPRQCLIVPNSTGIAGWEADLLVIQKSGWVDEVEIKVSVSDFKKEFTSPKKVRKHGQLVSGVPVTLFSMADLKHHETGKVEPHIVRRFWFAVPDEILSKVLPLVPPYAGLIAIGPTTYVGSVYRTRKVIQAPQLKMARQVTSEERTAAREAVYFRYWSAHHSDSWDSFRSRLKAVA